MPRPRSPPIGVAWQPWSGVAFARARDEHKPVLLSISAAWCHSCHEMDRTSYADPEIAAFINDRFVPVRVDADDRPDISERYSLGGWPTTAFLTPAATSSAAARSCARAHARGAGSGSGSLSGRVTSNSDRRMFVTTRTRWRARLDEQQLTAQVFASFDAEYGGFGVEPKFPHTCAAAARARLVGGNGRLRARTNRLRPLDANRLGRALRRRRRRILSICDDARLAAAALRKAARRQRHVGAPVSRGRRETESHAFYRTRGRHASLHPELAGRSGRRRVVRVAAGGRPVLRRSLR